MQNKIHMLILFSTLMLITLTACSKGNNNDIGTGVISPTSSKTSEGSVADTDSTPNNPLHSDHLQKELDPFLIVDAKVALPEDNKLPLFDVELAELPMDKIEKTFVTSHNDSMPSSIVPNEVGFTDLVTSNGNGIQQGKGVFSYDTPNSSAYSEIVIFDMGEDRLLNQEEAKKEDFTFQNREQIQQTLLAALKSLGMADIYTYNYDIYAFDRAALKKKQTQLLENDEDYKFFSDIGKIKLINDWSKANDIYYISFTCSINGIPIADRRFDLLNGGLVQGFEGYAIVSENGIEGLSMDAIWGEPVSKSVETLISLDDLLVSVRKMYDDIILTSVNTITDIQLEYCPIPDLKEDHIFTPVYVVTTQKTSPPKKEGQEPYLFTTDLYFSALNGEEIR